MNTCLLPIARYARELSIDSREVAAHAAVRSEDFEVDGYRFIHELCIDDIQRQEMASDEYALGCFNPEFMSEVTGIDSEVIRVLQHADAYEALGRLLTSLDKVGALQAAYADADGYGHYFNRHDGEQDRVGDYFVFRCS